MQTYIPWNCFCMKRFVDGDWWRQKPCVEALLRSHHFKKNRFALIFFPRHVYITTRGKKTKSCDFKVTCTPSHQQHFFKTSLSGGVGRGVGGFFSYKNKPSKHLFCGLLYLPLPTTRSALFYQRPRPPRKLLLIKLL